MINIYAHNGSGFDFHLLMNKALADPRVKILDSLPYNTEKFRTVRINNFQFKDSLAFSGVSLEKLVEDLHTRKVIS